MFCRCDNGRDVTEPANIRIHADADFMCKIRRMRMWICRAIKITNYYSYCYSAYLLKLKQLQMN